MSAQSRQARIHCRRSIFSATQASAQLVQMAEQNMACRTASASGSLSFPATSGWAAIIWAMDMTASPARGRMRNGFFGPGVPQGLERRRRRSEEHTSELQSLMRISYDVFCLKNKKHTN